MNLLNKALLRMSGWSRTTWCLAILMTVAFVLIGRLAQLQVFDTFDLEKKIYYKYRWIESYNHRAAQFTTAMASPWR